MRSNIPLFRSVLHLNIENRTRSKPHKPPANHQRRIPMALYVDGYVLPVPKDKIDLYRQIAEKAAKIWREHGALDYRECVGDDLDVKDLVPPAPGNQDRAADPSERARSQPQAAAQQSAQGLRRSARTPVNPTRLFLLRL